MSGNDISLASPINNSSMLKYDHNYINISDIIQWCNFCFRFKINKYNAFDPPKPARR